MWYKRLKNTLQRRSLCSEWFSQTRQKITTTYYIIIFGCALTHIGVELRFTSFLKKSACPGVTFHPNTRSGPCEQATGEGVDVAFRHVMFDRGQQNVPLGFLPGHIRVGQKDVPCIGSRSHTEPFLTGKTQMSLAVCLGEKCAKSACHLWDAFFDS